MMLSSNGKLISIDSIISLVIIVFFGTAAYLPFIGRLGFYWDDWYLIAAGHFFGPSALAEILAVDRPGSAYLGLLYYFFGNNPVPWQITIVAHQLFGALCLRCVILFIWPRRRYEATATAAIYLIYPGFSQQPICLAYSFHFAALNIFLLSTILSLKSIQVSIGTRKKTNFFKIIAAVLAFLYMFIVEHFFMLEAFRFAFLGLYLFNNNNHKHKLCSILTTWIRSVLPYLMVTSTFLIWRLFLFFPEKGTADQQLVWQTATKHSLNLFILQRLMASAQDFYETTILSWRYNPLFFLRHTPWGTPDLLAVTGFVIGVGYYSYIHLTSKATTNHLKKDFSFGATLSGVGMITSFLALLPQSFVLRKYFLFSARDRYCLPALPALAIFMMGCVFLIPWKKTKGIILALILGYGLAFHGGIAKIYAEEYDRIRDFAWQLVWRAPALTPHTLVVLAYPNLMRFYVNYGIWGPINFVYGYYDRKFLYWGESLEQYAKHLSNNNYYTSVGLLGLNYLSKPLSRQKSAIIFYQKTPTCCLRLIEPAKFLPLGYPEHLRSIAKFSHPERIIYSSEPTEISGNIFGPEPPRKWCWYYQHAMCAMQKGDYAKVIELYRITIKEKLTFFSSDELLPFIEAFFRLHQREMAENLIILSLSKANENDKKSLDIEFERLRSIP